MFYSHTLLARKTALGTVWCAAHLQHRLNKKDYEKTKIPVVVDAIMFGEVPLALRTSSYLLLGVVRIYSKQIDYLKHDVDVLVMELQKMHSHASAKLTLPENAYQAPFHSITLPETFDLDALELDSDIYHEGIPDNHLRRQEEITLEEQVAFGRDAYVAISFDEDIMMDSSHPVEVPDFMNVHDFGPSDQGMPNDDDSQQHVPEIEVQVEAVPDFSPIPGGLPIVPPVGGDDMSEPPRLIDEAILPESARPPTSGTSQEALDMTDTHISFGAGQSPMEPVLQPTPAQQPRPRSRKRKNFFDESIVLTNEFIKKALENSRGLLRERRNTPSTSLDVWKLNNSLRKDEVFYHPSITGLCHDLGDMFNMDYIATKCRSKSLDDIASAGETFSPPVVAPSPDREAASSPHFKIPPTDPASASFPVMETEHLHDVEGETFFPPSPDREAASSPHFEIPPTDPASASFPAMEIEHLRDVEAETFFAPSPVREAAASPHFEIPPTDPASASFPAMETEHLHDIEGNRGDDTLAELDEELYFLEADNSPPGSQGTQRVDSLSVRTRAVGQYLMSLSPIKLISDDSTQDLCLNDILEGKRRNLCARMFYEMLVLKSYGLIDVQQDVPFGNITLKLTSKLSKAQI